MRVVVVSIDCISRVYARPVASKTYTIDADKRELETRSLMHHHLSLVQAHGLGNVVGATFVAKDNLVVICVLSADNRCSVQLAHIFRVDKGTTLAALLQSARPLKLVRKGSVIATESARDIVVHSGMYLGFIKVVHFFPVS